MNFWREFTVGFIGAALIYLLAPELPVWKSIILIIAIPAVDRAMERYWP